MIVTVANAAELQAALGQVAGGDVIELESGDYGSFNFNNLLFNDYVTITSNGGAVFAYLGVKDSRYLRIDRVHVSSTWNGAASSKIVEIRDSNHIEFINSEVNGPVDSDYLGHYAIYTNNTDSVIISGNYIHDSWYGGVFYTSTHFVVSENIVDKTGSDCFKFIGIHDFLIENNEHSGNFFPGSTGAHVDFMQFQGMDSSFGVIRGNVCLAGNFAYFQGIFLKGAVYTNILIEQNIIYTAMGNGIKVAEGSGITVRDNTILHLVDPYNKATFIIAPSGSAITNNITTSTDGGLVGSNLVLQTSDPGDAYFYGDFFVNAEVGLGIGLEDLRPVAGSLAETYGAVDRIMELLDGTQPAPTPDPTPDPDPEPEPTPDPEPEPPVEVNMISQIGPFTFDGTIASAVVVPHDPVYELAEGSVEMLMTTSAIGGLKGLFSKDASGYGNGGHLAILMDGALLWVRLQSTMATYAVKAVDTFQSATEYHLTVTWGAGGLVVWVNGVVVGSDPWPGGTVGNLEPIVLGANQWASSAETADVLNNPFDGTITRLSVYGHALDGQEIADIINPPVCEDERDALLIERVGLLNELNELSATILGLQNDVVESEAVVASLSAQVASLEAKIAVALVALA